MENLFNRFLETIDYKITEGSPFGWNCFPDARYIDSTNEFGTVTAIFSHKDRTVYQIEVQSENHPNGEFYYRWIHPNWIEAYKKEEVIQFKKNKYKSDIEWIDLDVVDDVLEKARATLEGEEFDKRVMLEVELDEDVLHKLMLMAHQRDITLNQLMTEIIRAEIERTQGT